jgi:hypothetical protein
VIASNNSHRLAHCSDVWLAGDWVDVVEAFMSAIGVAFDSSYQFLRCMSPTLIDDH